MQIKVYKINGHLKLEISMWIKVIDVYYTKAFNFVVQNYGFDEDWLNNGAFIKRGDCIYKIFLDEFPKHPLNTENNIPPTS